MLLRILLLLVLFVPAIDCSAAEPADVADHQKNDEPASWKIDGEYEVKLDFRKNFALDRPNRDDLFRFDQEFQLRWSYRYNDWISFLLEGKIIGEHELYTGGRARKSQAEPERGEAWVNFENLMGRDLSFRLGRQNFEEPRRWWWDDDLDTVAVRYRSDTWQFELGVGEELPRKSLLEDYEPESKGVLRVLARTTWSYFKEHSLDMFFLHQYDRSPTQRVGNLVNTDREDASDARLWWGGLRAAGKEPLPYDNELYYWADLALVYGKEKLLTFEDAGGNKSNVIARKRQRVRGWAIDFGARLDTQLPGQPLFTAGYAIGSGDKSPGKGSDRAFRQTGLQSNDEEFRTYGELLRPELSNLSIPVLAVQFPIFWRSHVEFAYRHFRQVHAAPFLRDARIEAEPNGVKKNIGHEWMLYSAIKRWKDVELELVGAAFKAGNAYGARAGKMAYSFFSQITYGF
jgi:hypothetical protein